MYTFGCLEEDVRLVLSGVTRPWSVPAQALDEAIENHGWKIRIEPLPENQLCVCDAWLDTLILSTKLNCPKIRHWLLGTQLGLIRLHSKSILIGEKETACAHRATQYAMAFLLPRTTVTAHFNVTSSQSEQQKQIDQISDLFQVPVACVLAALEHYDEIEIERQNQGWFTPRISDPESGFWAIILNVQ